MSSSPTPETAKVFGEVFEQLYDRIGSIGDEPLEAKEMDDCYEQILRLQGLGFSYGDASRIALDALKEIQATKYLIEEVETVKDLHV